MKMNRLRRLTRADTAFGFTVLTLAGVVFWQVHTPVLGELRELGARLVAKRQLQSRLAELDARIANAQSLTEQNETRLVRFHDRFLAAAANGSHLETLSGLQDRCKVAVEQVQPGAAQFRDPYEIRPLRIVSRGSYGNLLRFIYELRNAIRSAEFESLEFSTDPNDATCLLTMQIKVHTESNAAVSALRDDAGARP